MIIDKKILDEVTEKEKASPRLRCNLDLRNSAEDQSQRMLNVGAWNHNAYKRFGELEIKIDARRNGGARRAGIWRNGNKSKIIWQE